MTLNVISHTIYLYKFDITFLNLNNAKWLSKFNEKINKNLENKEM